MINSCTDANTDDADADAHPILLLLTVAPKITRRSDSSRPSDGHFCVLNVILTKMCCSLVHNMAGCSSAGRCHLKGGYRNIVSLYEVVMIHFFPPSYRL